MREAVEKLQKAGVKTVRIELPQVAERYRALFDFFKAAGSGVSQFNLDAVKLLTRNPPAYPCDVSSDWGAVGDFCTTSRHLHG